MLSQVSLAAYTTFKTGGPARYFVTVTTVDELKAAVVWARAQQLRFFVLGGGSNVLAADEGYDGLVILIKLQGREYTTVSETEVQATFAAGEVFDEVVEDTAVRGLWGLENLSAIPGTVGATPVQNVGAYGVEVADIVLSVTVFNCDTLSTQMLDVADCGFTYRDSVFKRAKNQTYIITAVTFALSTQPRPQLSYSDLQALQSEPNLTPGRVRQHVAAIRAGKFPDWTVVGTAGSFFKNPIVPTALAHDLQQKYPTLPTYVAGADTLKVSLGFILDKICGLKGFKKNHIRLYENQALVVVAESGATTTDVRAFASDVARIVFEKTNIVIEHEVTFVE